MQARAFNRSRIVMSQLSTDTTHARDGDDNDDHGYDVHCKPKWYLMAWTKVLKESTFLKLLRSQSPAQFHSNDRREKG